MRPARQRSLWRSHRPDAYDRRRRHRPRLRNHHERRHPTKPMTEDQAAFLQDYVKRNAEEFQSHMINYRPGIDPQSMQGQILSGHDALRAGLIDALVSGFDEALALVA